jgi:hypothetical protein
MANPDGVAHGSGKQGGTDMRNRIIAIGLAVAGIGSATGGQALAWGCTAVASDGAYGYSNDWPSEQDAELRALQECDKRTTTNDCATDQCDPNS